MRTEPQAILGRASVAVLLLSAVGAAAIAVERPVSRAQWGTADRILTHIGFADFVPQTNLVPYSISTFATGQLGIHSTSSDATFFVALRVPSGVRLTYLELDFCDSDPSGFVTLSLRECAFLGDDCQILGLLTSNGSMQTCGFESQDLTGQDYTVDNGSRQLFLVATIHGGTALTQLNGASIGYELQISSAPLTATFGDVPTTHLYFRAIEALAGSGITSGCGSGNFCPNQNVTRGEMAAFLARALGLHFPN